MTDQSDATAAFDQDHAMWEGWAITHYITAKDAGSRYRIEPHQNSERFADQGDVWAFMIYNILQGSEYHKTALGLIQKNAVTEWERMVNYTRLKLDGDLEALMSEDKAHE